MNRDRIEKVRTLAERGATEGERAAAREALKRMKVNSVKSNKPRVSSIVIFTAGFKVTTSTCNFNTTTS
jgi:hypothetical protein